MIFKDVVWVGLLTYPSFRVIGLRPLALRFNTMQHNLEREERTLGIKVSDTDRGANFIIKLHFYSIHLIAHNKY